MPPDPSGAFQRRAVDRPGVVPCTTCGADVRLPVDELWLNDGQALRPPTLVSFRCPHCRRRIYLDPKDEVDRARDEAADAANDEG